MKRAAFKIGDRVRLEFGGPIMVVKKVSGGKVWCRFFDDNGDECEGEFHAENLGIADMPCRYVVDTKHPEYSRGVVAFQWGYGMGQTGGAHGCPMPKSGFNNDRFHWLCGFVAARTADRLWRNLPPGWDAVNRLSCKMDCG